MKSLITTNMGGMEEAESLGLPQLVSMQQASALLNPTEMKDVLRKLLRL